MNYRLLGVCILVIGLGVGLMYGASARYGMALYGEKGYFFYRQLWYGVFGVFLMIMVSKVRTEYFFRFANILLVFTVMGLILVLIPGIGVEKKGARRWIDMGFGLNIQPSEIAKVTLLIYISSQLARKKLERIREVLALLMVVGVIFLLIFLEEDFSTATVCLLSGMSLIFIGGIKFRYLLYLFLTGLPVVYFLMTSFEHMKGRMIGYLSKFLIGGQVGYQERQANQMIGSAGYWGEGLGVGSYYGRVPELHTDFYFVGIVSDVGLVGGGILLLILCYMYLSCLKVGSIQGRIEDRYLVYGLSLSLIWQTFLNLGSVLGLLPIAGLPLPFLSYGGNAMMSSALGMGLILGISRGGGIGR